MNNSIAVSAVCLTFAIVLAGSVGHAAQKAVRIEDAKELLKFDKDILPPKMMGQSIFRLSPSGERYIYIRMYPGQEYQSKLHFGQFKPHMTDSAAIWDRAVPAFYCSLTFAGVTWRSDSQRVLFLQEVDTKHDKGHRMTPWEMKWDLKNPQLGRASHMEFGKKESAGCTSASYSSDGKTLWTAFSCVKSFKVCGITEKVRGRAMPRVVYRNTGRLIHYLAPSPDGKLLSWVETYRRKRGGNVGPDVVVADAKSGKVVRRISLPEQIPGWLDAKGPVWTADSAAICYGDVVETDRIWRREVRVTRLSGKTSRLLARDSIAIGAAGGGIVLNRGPACTPMRQHISSFAPMGSRTPTTNSIIFCSLDAKSDPVTLIENAFAEHVRSGTIVYSQPNGDDILIMKATIKARPGFKGAAGKRKGTD